jgi:hypothetical protein
MLLPKCPWLKPRANFRNASGVQCGMCGLQMCSNRRSISFAAAGIDQAFYRGDVGWVFSF